MPIALAFKAPLATKLLRKLFDKGFTLVFASGLLWSYLGFRWNKQFRWAIRLDKRAAKLPFRLGIPLHLNS